MSGKPALSESYSAVAESVPLARHAVTRFARSAGASEEQVAAVSLAVSEALTNVVEHAYDDGQGSVHVASAVTGEELWVLVSDDGVAVPARCPPRRLLLRPRRLLHLRPGAPAAATAMRPFGLESLSRYQSVRR